MFHRLLDQIGQTQCSGGLQAVHSGRFTATDTLQKMLELGIERFDRGGAHLLDEAVIPIQQLTVIGGIPLMARRWMCRV